MSKRVFVLMTCKKEVFRSYCLQGLSLYLFPGRACFVVKSLDSAVKFCRTYNRFKNRDYFKSPYVCFYHCVDLLKI